MSETVSYCQNYAPIYTAMAFVAALIIVGMICLTVLKVHAREMLKETQ